MAGLDIKDDNIMITIEDDTILTDYVKYWEKLDQPRHVRSEDGRITYLSQGDFGRFEALGYCQSLLIST